MNENISASMATLAAIKSFYQEQHDFIGVFSSILLTAMPPDKGIKLKDLPSLVSLAHGIEIPEDVCKTLVKRLKKLELITYSNIDVDIYINEAGKLERVKNIEAIGNHQRGENKVIADLKTYIDSRLSQDTTLDAIKSEFALFISNNLTDTSFILSGGSPKFNNKPSIYETLIFEFLIETEKSNPQNFESIKSILYGKVISNTFETSLLHEQKKFGKVAVYLDTNFILSLFGVNHDYQNKASRELKALLDKSNFDLKIFNFTKDEITNILSYFIENYDRYTKEIPVDSPVYQLKMQDMTKQDVLILLSKLEEELLKLRISIDYTFRKEDLLQDRESFEKFKQATGKTLNKAEHDFCSINAIKKLRRNCKSTLVEDSRALFLTNDLILYKYNIESEGHSKSNTIPEAIYRPDLTSILWIKNPAGNDSALFYEIISSHLNSLLIHNHLWQFFLEELNKLKGRNEINDDDIYILVSSNETAKILRQVQSGEVSKKELPNLLESALSSTKENIKIKQEKLDRTSEKLSVTLAKLKNIEDKIAIDCTRMAGVVLDVSIIIAALILCGFILWLLQTLGLDKLANWIQLTGLVLPIVGVFALSIVKESEFRPLNFLIDCKRRLRSKLTTFCIISRKKKINFF